MAQFHRPLDCRHLHSVGYQLGLRLESPVKVQLPASIWFLVLKWVQTREAGWDAVSLLRQVELDILLQLLLHVRQDVVVENVAEVVVEPTVAVHLQQRALPALELIGLNVQAFDELTVPKDQLQGLHDFLNSGFRFHYVSHCRAGLRVSGDIECSVGVLEDHVVEVAEGVGTVLIAVQRMVLIQHAAQQGVAADGVTVKLPLLGGGARVTGLNVGGDIIQQRLSCGKVKWHLQPSEAKLLFSFFISAGEHMSEFFTGSKTSFPFTEPNTSVFMRVRKQDRK